MQIGTNKKIQETSKDLQRLRAIVRGGDQQQTLQVEKLTSTFTNAMKEYHESQKVIFFKYILNDNPFLLFKHILVHICELNESISNYIV